MNRCEIDWRIRHQDGDLAQATMGRERGGGDRNPHCGGTAVVPKMDAEDKDDARKVCEAEHKKLKAIVEEEVKAFNERPDISVPHKCPRIVVKPVKWEDRGKHFGYDQKDNKKVQYAACP